MNAAEEKPKTNWCGLEYDPHKWTLLWNLKEGFRLVKRISLNQCLVSFSLQCLEQYTLDHRIVINIYENGIMRNYSAQEMKDVRALQKVYFSDVQREHYSTKRIIIPKEQGSPVAIFKKVWKKKINEIWKEQEELLQEELLQEELMKEELLKEELLQEELMKEKNARKEELYIQLYPTPIEMMGSEEDKLRGVRRRKSVMRELTLIDENPC